MHTFYNLLLLVIAATPLAAQPFITCSASASVPPVVRAESHTELVGDLLLSCSSSTPGVQFNGDIGLFMNTRFTSREIGNGFSEALLLIDELRDPSVPSSPLAKLNIGVNAFQGRAAEPYRVQFSGVKFTTKATGPTILRITSVRAQATGIPPAVSFVSNHIRGYLLLGRLWPSISRSIA